ncbi:hypothetical protein F7725_015965 [Dissostichus mawsoni]|uniref:Uncharacterized protein n=1 Tax=Dissostichus mawsoni TaxID=36200 RepID=A0A7J5Y5K2_DISMA|nr:hypothetical protein F7725_015965 [Dissostichus mawsoni]
MASGPPPSSTFTHLPHPHSPQLLPHLSIERDLHQYWPSACIQKDIILSAPPPPRWPRWGSPSSARKKKSVRYICKTQEAWPRMTEEELGWHNREENDQTPEPLNFTPARVPGPTLNPTVAWSPLSIFRLFFSASVVHTIIANTNTNALKRLQAGKKHASSPFTTDRTTGGRNGHITSNSQVIECPGPLRSYHVVTAPEQP